MTRLIDLPPPSDADIALLKACAASPEAKEALARLLCRQLSCVQEYHLLNIELFKAAAQSEYLEDQVLEHMDDVWRRLSSDEIDTFHQEHNLLITKYHEIFVASEVYRNEMEHREIDQNAKKEANEND